MLSLICVYNNEEILEKYLLASLKEQTILYDIVLVDNRENKFKSAAEALNFGAFNAKGDFFVFLHQDISFVSKQTLKEIEGIIQKLPQNSIIGVAGVKDESGVISNIKHGDPPYQVGNQRVEDHKICQTVDECFFIVPKNIFNKLNFDATTCDGWHLYAVDYCLTAEEKLNTKTYVAPINTIYHRSDSSNSMNKSYYSILKRVTHKHKRYKNSLYTTMGVWPTSKIKLEFKITKIVVKSSIRKFINNFSIGRKFLELRKNRKKSYRNE